MKKFFKLAIGAVAAFWIISFSLARLPTKTTPSPQEDALKVIRIEIPEAENAFTYFQMATNINYLSYNEYDIETMTEGQDWDTNLISEIIETNALCFSYIEKGLACSRCLMPEDTYIHRSSLFDNNYNDDYYLLTEFRAMARLMAIKVRLLFKTGKEKEAFSLALLIVKMGHMIEDCGKDSVFYANGLSIKKNGLERIEEMIATTTLPSEDLLYYSKSLDQYPANNEALKKQFPS